MSLYNEIRPKDFSDVIGQEEVLRPLIAKVKKKDVPQVILLTGPSGVGKTTVALILKDKLECGDLDYVELNGADERGIDDIRGKILANRGARPLSGKSRIWYLDEVHQITKVAQQALLNVLEFTPKWSYFILSTTDPSDLLTTIITRSKEYKLKGLTPKHQKEILERACKKKKKSFSEEVIDRIIENAEGSARKALVTLEALLDIDDEDEQLDAIINSDSKRQAYELGVALIYKKSSWTEVVSLLKEIDDDPEGLRRMILSMAGNAMLKDVKGTGLARRSQLVIEAFRYNFYDTKKAGLCNACFDVCGPKQ